MSWAEAAVEIVKYLVGGVMVVAVCWFLVKFFS